MSDARPSWDFPRSPSVVRVMIAVGSEHGLTPADCLAGSGLRVPELEQPDVEVEAGQELTVARNLIRHVGDRPGLGAAVGKRINLGMSGVWGLLMLTSATVREMVEKSHRYGNVSWLFVRPGVVERAGRLDIVYEDSELPADLRMFLVERDLTSSFAMMPVLADLSADQVRFQTTLDRDRGCALLEVFPAEILEFDRPTNIISMRREVADRGLPNADPHAHVLTERYCDELAVRREQSVVARVRRLLATCPGKIAPAAELARALQIDERTLRRHLAAAGTSYRALATDVMLARARDALRDGLTVEQVSEELGFGDAASFSRAFRRGSGTTPGAAKRGGGASVIR